MSNNQDIAPMGKNRIGMKHTNEVEDVYPTGKHLFVKQVKFDHVGGNIFFAMIKYTDIFREPHYSTFKLRLLEVIGHSEQLPGCYSDWT
jgi:hypothetical protein